MRVSRSDYRALAAFRYEIRKFLAFSEQAARAAGLEPQQHQMLLAIHGLPESARPTIGAVADRLCVQHHTAVALADKLEGLGMVRRERGEDDRRQVFLVLTGQAASVLEDLSAAHRTQLRNVGPRMVEALGAILDDQRPSRGRRQGRREDAKAQDRAGGPVLESSGAQGADAVFDLGGVCGVPPGAGRREPSCASPGAVAGLGARGGRRRRAGGAGPR